MESGKLVVFYDGQCPFCVGWVKFLLDRDGADRLRFAALQGGWTARFFAERGLGLPGSGRLLVWDGVGLLGGSAAVAVLAGALPGIWRLGRHLRRVPEDLRERVYLLVAEHRYRWFGKYERCWVPAEADRRKFLDLGEPAPKHAGHGTQANHPAGADQRQGHL